MLVLTHAPSPQMGRCELTYVPRQEICYETAVRQHQRYCSVLEQLGVEVRTLTANRDFPDCAFIEDTAIVLDEVAILASMGTDSRRDEPAGVEAALSRQHEIRRIERPALIEGGDVLRVDRILLVGISSRTNAAGVAALEAIAGPLGYRLLPVPVRGCLHLKTACTALPDGRLLVNPAWVDTPSLEPFPLVPVPQSEPWGANVLVTGDHVLIAAGQPRAAERIAGLGFEVRTVEISEFAKAEGGVTCLSLCLK